MNTVRCCICFKHFPNLKNLTIHYLMGHSKLKIVRQLLKNSILQSTPGVLIKNKKFRKNEKYFKSLKLESLPLNRTQTLYLSDNIHILCSKNEIIIGDEKNSVGMNLIFDEDPNESKENYCVPLTDESNSHIPNRFQLKKNAEIWNTSTFKDYPLIKRKRENLEKQRHYRINIKKLKEYEHKSLDHTNGNFYSCYCKNPASTEKSGLNVITSDTESGSDTNVDIKLTCEECNDEFNSEIEFTDHMKTHIITCKICSDSFPSRAMLREHVKSHLLKIYMCNVCQMEFFHKEILTRHLDAHFEEHTYQTVLDMEQDYKIQRYHHNVSYSNSMNSIMCFLTDNHDFCCQNQKFMKVVCEICYQEMFLYDYEQHLQSVHYIQ